MKTRFNLLIKQTSSVEQACNLLDSTQSEFLVAVDSELHPAGVVTDLCVRKFLLAGGDSNAPLNLVMSDQFLIESPASDNSNPDPQAGISSHSGTGSSPIVVVVDGDNRALGARSDYSSAKSVQNNLVVLMVGGAGTRLRPLTERCPKPLLPVKGKPLLERTIEHLSALGFRRFCMAVGYMSEAIIDHFGDGSRFGVEISYINERRRLGTCGALRLLETAPDLPVLVMNGDLITNVRFDNLLRYHQLAEAQATLCVCRYDVRIPYGVVESEGARMVALKEKPTASHWINAGIYVLNPQTIQLIPGGREYDMPDLLQSIASTSGQVAVYPIREKWIDIGSLEEYARANDELEPASTVAVHPTLVMPDRSQPASQESPPRTTDMTRPFGGSQPVDAARPVAASQPAPSPVLSFAPEQFDSPGTPSILPLSSTTTE